MSVRHSCWLKVAVALAVCVGLFAGDLALASNMGYKMNRVIDPGVAPKENWVALPYRHPYQDMQTLCGALGLTNTTGKIIRLNPADGTQASWNCGGIGQSPSLNPADLGIPEHLRRAGLLVTNPTTAGGIIVGSHQSNPPGSIILKPLAGAPRGQNYFPVPYHTTSVTMQDVCVDLALPGTSAAANGKVERRNAATGVTTSWNCQAVGTAPNIVLGEAVRVTFSGASDIVVPAGHPAHF